MQDNNIGGGGLYFQFPVCKNARTSHPVVGEVKSNHCRPEGTSRVHAGACVRNLEKKANRSSTRLSLNIQRSLCSHRSQCGVQYNRQHLLYFPEHSCDSAEFRQPPEMRCHVTTASDEEAHVGVNQWEETLLCTCSFSGSSGAPASGACSCVAPGCPDAR